VKLPAEEMRMGNAQHPSASSLPDDFFISSK
jgi:hypothetical protein